MRGLALALVMASACVSSSRDRGWVEHALAERGAAPSAGRRSIEGGVSEQEAVSLALAHSPAYRAELARLDIATADLDEASRPANPQITVMGALGPISAFATLLAPLESLWQLPQRTEAASRELESVAESLVQVGLDLARDVRVAHAEVLLAEDRRRVRASLAETWTELSRIAEARVRLGDTSPAESATVLAEARLAADAVTSSDNALRIARARLRTTMGLDASVATFDVVASERSEASLPDLGDLIAIARTSRPDVRAAELSIKAAAARAGWERTRMVALAAQIEGHFTQPDAFAMRIGGRLEIPIFGANVGGRGRADAEVGRAEARLEQIRQRVVLEIIEAHTRAIEAERSLAVYRRDVLPALDEALRVATLSYELGEETYVVVLDVLRRIADARLREAELVAETRRAHAEIERAVGARLEEWR